MTMVVCRYTNCTAQRQTNISVDWFQLGCLDKGGFELIGVFADLVHGQANRILNLKQERLEEDAD